MLGKWSEPSKALILKAALQPQSSCIQLEQKRGVFPWGIPPTQTPAKTASYDLMLTWCSPMPSLWLYNGVQSPLFIHPVFDLICTYFRTQTAKALHAAVCPFCEAVFHCKYHIYLLFYFAGDISKPEEIFHIIEHFCLGRRRLHLFGTDNSIRPGPVPAIHWFSSYILYTV